MKGHCNLKRALVEEKLATGRVVELGAKNQCNKLNHLVAVLRTKVGDNLRVFNEVDGEWLAKVTDVSKKKVVIEIGEQLRQPATSNDFPIAVAFGFIKHHRLAILIEKCTEIGATSFIPLITEYTIAQELKRSKLEAYVLQAVEQSERLSVPTIAEAVTFKKFLEANQEANIVVLDPRSNAQPLRDVLAKLNSSNTRRPLVLAIGPEGGFSDAELDLAAGYQANIQLASLGQNILRAETAAIVALAQVLYCNTKNFPIPSSH